MTNKTDTKKRVFLRTFGCQMNEYESDVVINAFKQQGFAISDLEDEADVLIVNTCSVRDHAENRAFNKLHVWSRMKKNGRHGKKLQKTKVTKLGWNILKKESSRKEALPPASSRRFDIIHYLFSHFADMLWGECIFSFGQCI